MFIIFLAFCAPTRTLLTMLRSIALCRNSAMVIVSPTMETSLRTQVAVLAAKLHMRTLCGTSFREAVDAVSFPTALDMEDSSVENDLTALLVRITERLRCFRIQRAYVPSIRTRVLGLRQILELSKRVLVFDYGASSPCNCNYPSSFSMFIDSLRLVSSTSLHQMHECITTSTQPANHP
jgi:hypothetical protein